MPLRKNMDDRRGGVLVVLGIGYALTGLVNILTPDSPSTDLAFRWLPDNLGANELGALWVACGVTIAVIGLRAAHRPLAVTAGFILGVSVPALWGAIYFTSWFFGNTFGLRGAAVYLTVVTASVVYMAGWTNPISMRKAGGTDAS